jgi:hypothetical protein
MFSDTKCGNCRGSKFETVEASAANSFYKLFFFRCAQCKTPFAVTDNFSTAVLLDKQERKIDALGQQLMQLQTTVHHLVQTLQGEDRANAA